MICRHVYARTPSGYGTVEAPAGLPEELIREELEPLSHIGGAVEMSGAEMLYFRKIAGGKMSVFGRRTLRGGTRRSEIFENYVFTGADHEALKKDLSGLKRFSFTEMPSGAAALCPQAVKDRVSAVSPEVLGAALYSALINTYSGGERRIFLAKNAPAADAVGTAAEISRFLPCSGLARFGFIVFAEPKVPLEGINTVFAEGDIPKPGAYPEELFCALLCGLFSHSAKGNAFSDVLNKYEPVSLSAYFTMLLALNSACISGPGTGDKKVRAIFLRGYADTDPDLARRFSNQVEAVLEAENEAFREEGDPEMLSFVRTRLDAFGSLNGAADCMRFLLSSALRSGDLPSAAKTAEAILSRPTVSKRVMTDLLENDRVSYVRLFSLCCETLPQDCLNCFLGTEPPVGAVRDGAFWQRSAGELRTCGYAELRGKYNALLRRFSAYRFHPELEELLEAVMKERIHDLERDVLFSWADSCAVFQSVYSSLIGDGGSLLSGSWFAAVRFVHSIITSAGTAVLKKYEPENFRPDEECAGIAVRLINRLLPAARQESPGAGIALCGWMLNNCAAGYGWTRSYVIYRLYRYAFSDVDLCAGDAPARFCGRAEIVLALPGYEARELETVLKKYLTETYSPRVLRRIAVSGICRKCVRDHMRDKREAFLKKVISGLMLSLLLLPGILFSLAAAFLLFFFTGAAVLSVGICALCLLVCSGSTLFAHWLLRRGEEA